MSRPVVYRIEQQSVQTGQVLGTYGRQTVDRDDALRLWSDFVRSDGSCLGRFRPDGPHRLVVLADPRDGAPLNAEAAEDLLEAVGTR